MQLGWGGGWGNREADVPPTEASWLRRQQELLRRRLAEVKARLDELGAAQEEGPKHE